MLHGTKRDFPQVFAAAARVLKSEEEGQAARPEFTRQGVNKVGTLLRRSYSL